jgi:hypothetical protein
MKRMVIAVMMMAAGTLAYADAHNQKYIPVEPSQQEQQMGKATGKRLIEYQSVVVYRFIDSCVKTFVGNVPMNPRDSMPVAVTMCSCIMDQFRKDFSFAEFKKGGQKLPKLMGGEYSQICQQENYGTTSGQGSRTSF